MTYNTKHKKESKEINSDLDSEANNPTDLSESREVESAYHVMNRDRERNLEANLSGKCKRILITLWIMVREGTMNLEYQLKQYCCGDQIERTRTYHIWPGNNVFFFRGRLICGPDPRGLLLTAVSICLSSWIFSVYVADDLQNYSSLTITFSVVLTLVVLANLMLVSMIDPGIVPRNDQEFVEDDGINNRKKKRTKRVNVNGVEVKLKYCQICKIHRPPRSRHCAVCDNCVEKFDHHCPWIGQCVGLRNYRFYMTFIVMSLAFFIYIFSFSCWSIHGGMLRNGIGLFGMLGTYPEKLALVLFSCAAIMFLGCLACYHFYLIAVNQTAYENFHGCYMDSRNPYDKGIFSNVKEVFQVPMPPSKIDFRTEVTPSWLRASDSKSQMISSESTSQVSTL